MASSSHRSASGKEPLTHMISGPWMITNRNGYWTFSNKKATFFRTNTSNPSQSPRFKKCEETTAQVQSAPEQSPLIWEQKIVRLWLVAIDALFIVFEQWICFPVCPWLTDLPENPTNSINSAPSTLIPSKTPVWLCFAKWRVPCSIIILLFRNNGWVKWQTCVEPHKNLDLSHKPSGYCNTYALVLSIQWLVQIWFLKFRATFFESDFNPTSNSTQKWSAGNGANEIASHPHECVKLTLICDSPIIIILSWFTKHNRRLQIDYEVSPRITPFAGAVIHFSAIFITAVSCQVHLMMHSAVHSELCLPNQDLLLLVGSYWGLQVAEFVISGKK